MGRTFDFNAGYNSCMVHMVIATSKALAEKGIPWSDVQKTLIEIVDDFHKIASEKKHPRALLSHKYQKENLN